MTCCTRDLIRRAAQTLLAHRDAQRVVDPLSVQWAERVLAQNPAPCRCERVLNRGTRVMRGAGDVVIDGATA